MQEITRVAAYGLVVEHGRILLCRISARVPSLEGWWILPGGGVEFAEHPEQAMVRELFEETGLVVRSTGLVAVDSVVREHDDHTFHGIRLLYTANVEGGKLRPEQDGSTDACAWIPLNELHEHRLVGLAERGVRRLRTPGTT